MSEEFQAKKPQGLHKSAHNSRKKLETQKGKSQNSSKKLVSAKPKARFAENRSKRVVLVNWRKLCLF